MEHPAIEPEGGTGTPGEKEQPPGSPDATAQLSPDGKTLTIGDKEFDVSTIPGMGESYNNDTAWKRSNHEKSEKISTRDRELSEKEEKFAKQLTRADDIDKFMLDPENAGVVALMDKVMNGKLSTEEIERLVAPEIEGLDKDDPLVQRLSKTDATVAKLLKGISDLQESVAADRTNRTERAVDTAVDNIRDTYKDHFVDEKIGDKHLAYIMALGRQLPDVPLEEIAKDHFELIGSGTETAVKQYMDVKEEEARRLPTVDDLAPPVKGEKLSVMDGSAHKRAKKSLSALFGFGN